MRVSEEPASWTEAKGILKMPHSHHSRKGASHVSPGGKSHILGPSMEKRPSSDLSFDDEVMLRRADPNHWLGSGGSRHPFTEIY